MVLDIIVLVLLLIGMLIGYKNGLINGIFNLIGGLVAIVLALMTYKTVVANIVPKTGLETSITSYVEKVINNKEEVVKETVQNESKSSFTTIFEKLTGSAVIINQSITTETSKRIANFIINIMTIFILMSIYMIVILILKWILNGIVSLPFLKEANKLGGAVLGLVQSVFVILIIYAAIYFASAAGYVKNLEETINNSVASKFVYNNNIVVKIATQANINKILGDNSKEENEKEKNVSEVSNIGSIE